jgi:alkyl hydroperoxide reductase subunit AhpC
MNAQVGKPAPDFKLMGLVGGAFKEIRLSDFKGKKKVVLLFYPADFTFVCPTEILAFSDAIEEFWKRDTVVLGISVDSLYSHHAWTRMARKQGGIMGVAYPLLSDSKKEVTATYGVLAEESGQAMRGLFIVNAKGILKHITINHADLGRSVGETLRLLDAIHTTETSGVVCPANWRQGQKTIEPTQEGLETYAAEAAAP